jgi:hypothetical protein
MPPRRRKLGQGGAAGRDTTPRGQFSGVRRSDYPNAFNSEGQQLGQNPAGDGGRRALGQGPQPSGQNVRQAPIGINARRNRYEQAMFGAPNPLPQEGRAQAVNTRHAAGQTGFTPQDIRNWIDNASESLSLPTQQALLRAFEGDDSFLLTYRPTNTSSPRPDETERRPRTMAAGYDAKSMTLFVRFRGDRAGPVGSGQWAEGVGYEYYGVTPDEWNRFKTTPSPGRMINAVFNGHAYTPAAW